jgi:5-methylcytosine-specific restriction enzyme A
LFKKRCPLCNISFTTTIKNQKYCGSKCWKKNNYKPKPKKYHTKNCFYCNERFETTSPNQLSCSKQCGLETQKIKVLLFKKKTSFHIFERDNFTCVYCGKNSYEDNAKLIVEHIYPRSKGGQNDINNMITACSKCNGEKSAKLLDIDNILKLWELSAKRNLEKKLDYVELKELFDKIYKVKDNILKSPQNNTGEAC